MATTTTTNNDMASTTRATHCGVNHDELDLSGEELCFRKGR